MGDAPSTLLPPPFLLALAAFCSLLLAAPHSRFLLPAACFLLPSFLLPLVILRLCCLLLLAQEESAGVLVHASKVSTFRPPSLIDTGAQCGAWRAAAITTH